MITITLTRGERPITVGKERALVVSIDGLLYADRDDGGADLDGVHWGENSSVAVTESPADINTLIKAALAREEEERTARLAACGALVELNEDGIATFPQSR